MHSQDSPWRTGSPCEHRGQKLPHGTLVGSLLCKLQVRIRAMREIFVVFQFALVLISQTCIPNVNHDIVESRYPTGQIVTSRRSQRRLRSETIRVEKSHFRLNNIEVVQMSSLFSYFWQKVRRIPRWCGASQSAIPTDKPTFTCQVDFHWSGFLPVILSQSHRKRRVAGPCTTTSL